MELMWLMYHCYYWKSLVVVFVKLLVTSLILPLLFIPAPEVIDDLGYSQQCDIWSIGVIMYTL